MGGLSSTGVCAVLRYRPAGRRSAASRATEKRLPAKRPSPLRAQSLQALELEKQLEEEEDGRVLQHGTEDEDDAGDHPGLDRGEALCLWRVGLDRVVDVDEDEEEGDQHRHPPRHHLRVHQETEQQCITTNQQAGFLSDLRI